MLYDGRTQCAFMSRKEIEQALQNEIHRTYLHTLINLYS